MNRIRTNSVYRLLLFVACISHGLGSQSEYEETDLTSDTDDSQEESTTAVQTYRRSRMYRRGGQDESKYQDDHRDDHHDDMADDDQGEMKAITQSKIDYWGGYYDFLINEGSYKFWAVFQLATAALLIYSGFAALYYAKVNPPTTDDEFDDIFRRRRRRSLSIIARDRPFSGLDSATFQRIVDAIPRGVH